MKGDTFSGTQSTLSNRGQGIKAVRDDIPLFMAGLADPYDPMSNPDGYLVMLVAENKLMWKEMAQKLQEVQSSSPLPEWIFTYGSMTGQEDFIKAMANVFSKWIKVPPVDPKYVKTQAGAGSVLAQVSYLLGDTDDGVLVTAPNYPAFAGDFGVYGGMKLHTVQTSADTNYVPTVADLNQVYDEAVNANHPPRILIICQPNNPTGTVYSNETMHTMIQWALDKDLHVVSDEIYAMSVFPGYETTSAATVMYELNPDQDQYLGDYVHIVAGLSKDWGMSGFRVGTLFSHNEQLLKALELIGYYPSVSQYTQHALTQVFADDEWVDWYIQENQQRLWATYEALVAALDRIQVPVVPAEGALFAWADFSSLLLDGQTEKDLWLELFHDAKVIFTLGGSCNEDSPAMFRIVYPWPEGGPVAMKELGDRLVQWREARKTI
jgi:1-aminocyclopropane-1-carboxylate synthase